MRTRPFAVLSAVALSALLLAGCGSSPDADDTAAPTETGALDLCSVAVPSGELSDSITVEGEPGTPSTAAFEAPLEIPSAERTIVVEGDGDPIEDGDIVQYAVTVFDATTGELTLSGGYDTPLLPVAVTIGSGADQYFGCAPIGSRIVVAVPAAQGAAPSVMVLDVLGTAPSAAWGADQPAVDGMPTVELDEDGAPTITLPDGAAPEGVQIATLKKGDGPVVGVGDGVLVQYTGVKWSNGEVFDSSWERGAPVSFPTTGVVPGFQQALEGQTVGSQVLVVMSPEFGYGEGEINETDLKGETLVFVIDILAMEPVPTQ